MHPIAIIADDLTGALDSAAGFAQRGLKTRVVTEIDDFTDALHGGALQVVAVSTGTRDGSLDAALAMLRAITAALGSFDGVIFKKIDSRLKGHIAAEVAQLAQGRALPVLACPAIPRLGRFVQGGAVTGAGVDSPISVAERLGSGLGTAPTIPEARTNADIDAALPDRLDSHIYVGAAGLAEALARRLAPDAPAPARPALPAPLIMAIGSRDPVTLAQVAQLSLRVIAAPDGIVPEFTMAPVTLVQMTAQTLDLDPRVAAAGFSSGIARAIAANAPRSLFMCGGETAQAILTRLGIKRLDLLGEVLPGVPLSRCADTGLTVITKSGGFGAAPLLADMLAMMDQPRGPSTGPHIGPIA
ncbi:four-carbon acid sugar kinase family protein [Roseinatronobacter sp. NSM]|uniref:four-carbon acid sugar kinase family protein n=1 Tax=Roseinatronobacter sp. NSM TaxID=3457785 RepID=UPI0040360456